MLKPFQIRNLRESEQELADSHSFGVVQISSTDYDDLATTHPRARLTYTEEDDEDEGDETITVGSALELSQRLEESPEIGARLDSLQLSHDAPPMHIFDIRRSNSVTELWRRYECEAEEQGSLGDVKSDVLVASQTVVHEDEVLAATSSELPPTSERESRSLMEAFETELAGILHAAEPSGTKRPRPESQPAEPSSGTSSERSTHPVEVLAAQVLDQLINGATMVQSEWRARLPEVQRQLHNAQRQFETAQRSLPANVEASLRTLLNTLEAQVRAAFSNIPDSGRQFAEDAFQRGRPVAENAADGLRMMASELNEAGRTLFAAFETEFGRAGPATPSTHEAPSSGVPGTSDVNANSAENKPASSSPTFSQVPDVHQSSSMTDKPHAPSKGHWNPSGVAESPAIASPGSCPSSSAYYYPPGTTDPTMQHSLYQQYLHQNLSPYYLPPSSSVPGGSYYGSPLEQNQIVPNWPQWPPTFSSLNSNEPMYPTQVYPTSHPNEPIHPGQVPPPLSSSEPIHPGTVPINPVNPEGSETKSLFIGNVGFKVTQKMIQDVFASKGFIVEVDLPMDSASGQHAGFGFVHFPGSHSAFAAMEALQGALIDGHSINLESMHHSNTESLRVARNRSGSGSGVRTTRVRHVNKPNRRRKSVSFSQHQVDVDTGSSRDLSSRKDSSGLLDSPSDDPGFSARFPSLQPVKNEQPSGLSSGQGISPPVKPEKEMEMLHFPPVSQLDALLLTNQQERPTVSSTTGTFNESEDLTQEIRSASNGDVTGNKLQVIDTGRSLDHSSLNGNSNPTAVMRPAADSNKPSASSLKRQSSARSAERDTWARLSRRERTRSFSRQQVPGGFPVEETARDTVASSVDQVSDPIEQCVSALVDMGFGTEQEGGRSRMVVYAAAANGSLLDAIDMIEEERSAYERRSSQ
ncbi:uncharacterized protein N7511_010587 [Penicillium nucicola]|uniref:uncharacterized protein n=1 Tax=Penicillium nucicola TaxID=1850975 RepID=UPI00254552B4|nr:uncharacterized protein N7511_010587 [Penicillium nucicola]KAJ5748891.1 hypothetical protein N7511_010587 [Penicillium nucicola]